jgi:sigma-54 specific flagellar transcriptional regulator A
VGSSESVAADFRLVAATNRDLLAEVRAGRFRQDLYYRLNVCPIHLPPLRERPGDVGPLFEHFWRSHGEHREIEPAVFQRLERHDWPGNVRELENLVERVSVIAEGPVIRLQDLPLPLSEDTGEIVEASGISSTEMDLLTRITPPVMAPVASAPMVASAPVAATAPVVRAPVPPPLPPPAPPLSIVPDPGLPGLVGLAPPEELTPTPTPVLLDGVQASHDLLRVGLLGLPVNLPSMLRELEEAYIAKALAQSGGNKKEAARLLGMGRTTLVEKLRRRNADTSAS